MAFDLSWLWNVLNSITSTLTSWFGGISSTLSSITNTGQGIFSGLLSFGSQLWDALTKVASTLGQWLSTAYNWVYQGLIGLGNTFGSWLNSAFNFVAQGVTWIGSQFYNIGNWVYNALYTTWNWIVNMVIGAWNNLVSWFSGVAGAIGTWWTSVVSGINTWWTNLLKGFRTKIVTTIQADISIAMAWKGAERILNPQALKDIPYGFFGILASPLVGRLVGEIANAVVPLPSSATYPLIPDIAGFSYTPPSMTVTTPTEKATPTPIVVGAPAGAFTGLAEQNFKPLMETYEIFLLASQDLSRQATSLSYEVWLS